MTDADLNRAVAEARGWTEGEPTHWRGEPIHPWLDASGKKHWVVDVCTDPGAWAELFICMQERRLYPGLTCQLTGDWVASVLVNRRPITAVDPLPGRALAKAFLASKGIST